MCMKPWTVAGLCGRSAMSRYPKRYSNECWLQRRGLRRAGTFQPWHVYVLTGEPLAELKRRATARALAGDPGDEREYPMYPAELSSPYLDRFSAAAAQRYKALGIERDDTPTGPRRSPP